MIRPQTFAIHVTYTCPLACAHCCFSSSPEVTDRLDIGLVLGAIAELDAEEIKLVAFTGGEPMLLGNDLVVAVRAAHARGFGTRVVTSAYFGRRREYALKRLAALVDAGLDELSISWDDFHEAFVEFSSIKTVFEAACQLGLKPAINIVQARESRWTADRVRRELGRPPGDDSVICESPLNKTGRAELDLMEEGLRATRFVGPCPYVLTGPTLSAKGKLLACCGVIPDTDALVIDAHFEPQRLKPAMEAALKSPLLNWLYLRGPYALAEGIAALHGLALPPREAVGGNCEACKVLFETREIAERIDGFLAGKAENLSAEHDILKALGMDGPYGSLSLWEAASKVGAPA